MTTMHWQSTADIPAERTVGLIARRDPCGGGHYLLGELYMVENGEWRSETTGEPLPEGAHYWLPERELLLPLREAA